MISKLHVKEGSLWRPATANDLAGALLLEPMSSVIELAVTTSSQTLAALIGGSGIDAGCTWIALQLRDDQTAGQVVRINYTGAASATAYDATLSLDPARADSYAADGKGTKALFDLYQLVSNAAATVLLRQFREV